MTDGNLQTTKINESFYRVKGSIQQLQPIMRKLQVKIPTAHFDPMVKRGLKKLYEVFYNVHDGDLIIPSGLIPFLYNEGVYAVPKTSTFTKDDITNYINTLPLPFEP